MTLNRDIESLLPMKWRASGARQIRDDRASMEAHRYNDILRSYAKTLVPIQLRLSRFNLACLGRLMDLLRSALIGPAGVRT